MDVVVIIRGLCSWRLKHHELVIPLNRWIPPLIHLYSLVTNLNVAMKVIDHHLLVLSRSLLPWVGTLLLLMDLWWFASGFASCLASPVFDALLGGVLHLSLGSFVLVKWTNWYLCSWLSLHDVLGIALDWFLILICDGAKEALLDLPLLNWVLVHKLPSLLIRRKRHTCAMHCHGVDAAMRPKRTSLLRPSFLCEFVTIGSDWLFLQRRIWNALHMVLLLNSLNVVLLRIAFWRFYNFWWRLWSCLICVLLYNPRSWYWHLLQNWFVIKVRFRLGLFGPRKDLLFPRIIATFIPLYGIALFNQLLVKLLIVTSPPCVSRTIPLSH